jgi:hypothetical protein
VSFVVHSFSLRKQRRILKLFGTIDFDPEYDYKAERRRKRNVSLWLER